MAEPDKQQIGEGGGDNPAEAAKQLVNAAKQTAGAAGKAGASAAAGKAVSAGASATTATASAAAAASTGATAGQAAAQIAAGAASGGPWGAVLAALWAMRHTLFKILICVCLCLLFLIVLIADMPSILWDYMSDGDAKNPGQSVGVTDAYSGLAGIVRACLSSDHQQALDKVKQLISDGGYDSDKSMAALTDNVKDATDAEICYILAAYSVSMRQQNTSTSDLQAKLDAAAGSLFAVASTEKEDQTTSSLTYTTYKQVTVTVVTGKTQTGAAQYAYTLESKDYYTPAGQETTTAPITRDAYWQVTVEIPVYTDGTVTGTKNATYYEKSGAETLTPETSTVKYLACTISPLNDDSILNAFGIAPSAVYADSGITNAQAIDNMESALEQILFGSGGTAGGDTAGGGVDAGGGTVIQADPGTITQIGKYPIPVTGKSTITSTFGYRIDPVNGKPSEFHAGLDIAGAHYCQIIAIADGTVTFAGLSGDTNIVTIKHIDENGKVFYSRYLHLAKIYVKAGQAVTARQVIGLEGGDPNTDPGAGHSTGPHLHFELRDANNVAFNPYHDLYKPVN